MNDEYYKFDPAVQRAACLTLQTLDDDKRTRTELLSRIRKSKLGKMVHAVGEIVGSWTNWAMIGAGWAGDFVQGMVSGALIYYRSELLLTAQSVAAAAVAAASGTSTADSPTAAAGGGGGAAAAAAAAGAAAAGAGAAALPSPAAAAAVPFSPYQQLMSVVSAIIISELAKIVVQDIKSKMDEMGEQAIRKRLEYMLGERLLAQDLETVDDNRLAQERSYGWGLTPQQLLRSFPLEKFFNLPRNFLRVVSTTGTTAYLLWSKNAFLSLVVLAALLAKRWLLDRAGSAKNYLWWAFFSAPHVDGSQRSRIGSISIFQALKNFYDVRVNGNELFHLKQLHKKDVAEAVAQDRRDAFDAMYHSVSSIVREMPTIVTYVVGCGLIVKRTLAPSDLVMFPTSIQDMLDDWEELLAEYAGIYDFEARSLDHRNTRGGE